MSPEQRELARHALGLPNTSNRSYRNRYTINQRYDSGIKAAWDALVSANLAVRGAAWGGLYTYALTAEGAALSLEIGETLDPEDFEA